MLVRIDAVFEAALGIALLVSRAQPAHSTAPTSRGRSARVVLAIVGVALLVLAVLIWSGRVGLRALVVCNAASALAGIVWLAAVSGFSTAGTIAVVA